MKKKSNTRLQRKLNYNIAKSQLNEEQWNAKLLIEKSPVTIVTGKAGSGKTFLAVAIGLEKLIQNDVEKLYFIRPTVGTEDIGYLKGGLGEKMQPWMKPIHENIKDLIGIDGYEMLEKENRIEVLPLQFARGITMKNSYVIVDECQNLTVEQTSMVLTRLGKNSQMVLVGDIRQIDLKSKSNSGLKKLVNMIEYIDEMGFVELKENHRHSIVDKILSYMNGESNLIAI